MNPLSNPKRVFNPNPLKPRSGKDGGIDRFYVYILKLDNGRFYIGHTKDLSARITEHKEGQTISTAGENPKLCYFEIFPTRGKAMVREYD
jgi:predicted GIY-YIG superfamily endonuclease